MQIIRKIVRMIVKRYLFFLLRGINRFIFDLTKTIGTS